MQDHISQARVDANRENAQKSCGPTTQDGKARSSLNALKHGLTGQYLLFSNDEDVKRYQAHAQTYETQFEPVGPEECALVQSIADIRWRLSTIPGLELAILSTGKLEAIKQNPALAAPMLGMMLELDVRRLHEKELHNLQLQENRLARRREREMAELLRLQAERKAKEEEALAEAAKATLLAQHRNQTLPTVPGVGFVFSEKKFAKFMSSLKPAQKEKFLQEAIAEGGELPETMRAAA